MRPGALKRTIDVLGAAAGLTVLSPMFIGVVIAVRRRLGTPVLFHQERVGRDEQPFRLHKFRSMADAYDESGALLPDAERLTPFGAWLRSSSLDELPELWNVLCGEMSLVGPRPLPVHYLERYRAYERRRHVVRPGITGWAQVNGRNEVTWDDRLEMDVWYVDNRSLLLDLKIIVRTLATVMMRRGISEPGGATMSELPQVRP